MTEFNLPPTSFSSDGSTSGGNGEQQNVPVTPEPQREQAPQAPQRSESQQKSATIAAEIKARGLAGEKLSSQDMARLQKHSLWRDGLTHLEPVENIAAKPEDHREHDSLRSKLEDELTPINQQVSDRLLARAKVQGVAPNVAEAGIEICRELGLDEAASSTLMARVAKHSTDEKNSQGFVPLDEAERAEFVDASARALGGLDKLEALSARARQFLEYKGVLAEYDKAGLTNSSLAYDPRVLLAMAFSADRAGLPKGKK